MKIVHLVGYYTPELGYQENYLAEEHKKMGHEVNVITSNLLYPFPNIKGIMKQLGMKFTSRKMKAGTENVGGIKVHRLPAIFEYADFILLSGLKRKLREISPDIVFAHESRQSPPYYAAKWKKELGYVLVTDQHDFHHNIPRHNPVKKILRELDYFFVRNVMVRKTLARSDAIIAVTQETKNYLVRTFGLHAKDVYLVELGVDIGSFRKSQKARLELRKKYGIKNDEVVFSFAGTIVRRKGIELLIDAFSQLKIAKSRLMIIGDGDKGYLQELKDLAKKKTSGKNIIFPGFVPKEKLPGYFSAVDVGVWPGNNSVIIMEAMACELPIIMVDLQLSHLVKYSNGFSFVENDMEALKACMRKMMDVDRRKNMGQLSRKAVVDNYSYKKIAEKFIEIAKKAGKKR